MGKFKQQKLLKIKYTMKPVLYTLLLILFVSCHKEKPIEKITVTGTVCDTNSNLLDSVKITLYESCFMCLAIPIETKYSKDGVFGFEITLEKDYSYYLRFEKKGYTIASHYGVDKKKEKQHFNVIMERVEE